PSAPATAADRETARPCRPCSRPPPARIARPASRPPPPQPTSLAAARSTGSRDHPTTERSDHSTTCLGTVELLETRESFQKFHRPQLTGKRAVEEAVGRSQGRAEEQRAAVFGGGGGEADAGGGVEPVGEAELAAEVERLLAHRQIV